MKPLTLKSLLMGLSFGLCLGFAKNSQAGYETCYEQEYRCETRYEQSCHYENQCHTVPGHQECRQVRLCTPRPSVPNCQQVTECGRNAQGQEICKTREVCSGSSGGGEDCDYVQECSNTGPQQQCSQQQVCNNVPQQSCGYETVAKQCWVPDPTPPTPPPYYPPTPQPEPEPQPPYYPPTPDPEPEPLPPYYPPSPDPLPPIDPPIDEPDEIDEGDQDDVHVPGALGSQSVVKVELKIAKAKTAVVSFRDKGQGVTYKTRYFISIIDKSGVVILNQHATADGKVQQSITLNQKLSEHEDHTPVLRVLRSGGELVKDISFVKTVFRAGTN